MSNRSLIKLFDAWGEENIVLTGSRRFGSYTGASDWDFVADVKHYSEWRDFFRDYNFTRVDTKEYFPVDWKCKDTHSIWERVDKEGVKIQIVISNNYEGKKRIIEWLADRQELMLDYYTVPKNQRYKIWHKLQEEMEKGNI